MSLLPGEESVLDISAILPEQDTSTIALPHGQSDQAVGTVEGANPKPENVLKSEYDQMVIDNDERYKLMRELCERENRTKGC